MNFPQVDIVIPSYRPRFFRQALKSALSQTYEKCRIFVSDNCPTEEILKIINDLNCKNIIYHRSVKIGVDNYLNSFEMGSGQLIKPLFDDDILSPFCVERFVRAYLNSVKDDGLFFAFSRSGVIDTQNFIYRDRKPFKKSCWVQGGYFSETCIREMHNFIGEFSSVIFSRSLLDILKERSGDPFIWRSVDGRTGLPDVCFFMNAAEFSNFLYLDEQLSFFRRSSDHLSDSNVDKNPNPEIYRIFTNWFDLYLDYVKESKDLPRNIDGPNRMLSAAQKKFPSNEKVLEKCATFKAYLSSIGFGA